MVAQHDESHQPTAVKTDTLQSIDHAEGGAEAHASHEEHKYDPAATAVHHISDANVYSILDFLRIPLPTILYAKDKGLDVFMSSAFHPGHHDDGHQAHKGYVMYHGSVYRINDPSFSGEGEVESFIHKTETINNKERDIFFAKIGGQEYKMEQKTIIDGGILGGGFTSFYDFSLTKNVLAMIIVCLILWWMFSRMVKYYKQSPEKAPAGITNFVEPVFLFLRDEVAIPFIGKDKYKKYFPLLLSIFFFILGLNLFGQVPFLGSINATGNLAITLVLAVIVFLVVNLSGKKDYWKHIFWMPGVPTGIKPLLAVVEFASVFIKPLTLMLRLAGNISAGHIAILSFISLIFIFGNSGANLGGGVIGTVMAIPLTLFMMAIELLVAFLQAYVFTLLTASYIGAATEEHDHH